MTTEITAETNMIHILYDGRQHDVRQDAMDVGPLSTDAEVKTALAVHLDVPIEKFRNYAVRREPNGNMTLSPEAVFGA